MRHGCSMNGYGKQREVKEEFMSIDVTWLSTKFADLDGLAPLNSGGQKWVFSANHKRDGNVVLKLFKPLGTPAGLELVFREMIAAQTVASHRVPKILEHGEIDTPLGKCYWFREFRINGDDLSTVLKSGPLDTTKVLRLGLHTLDALSKAETELIVHRDVKPQNIMMDISENFWLLDFGLARHLTLASITPTADSFGKCTPGYAPPEQFRNVKSEIDARADLFALGVTLYECATGANPFFLGARNVLDVLRNVESLALAPLSLKFAASNDFRDLVATMTQKRRDQRVPSVAEALDWMRDICTREKVV